jgi:hypothetical protein
MAGVSDKELIPIGPFPAGIDNLDRETELTRSEDGKRVIALREAENVDLPRSGWPRRRRGFAREVEGTRVHSLWSGGRFPLMLFVDGATQYARRTGAAPFAVRSGLSPREVSYAIPNDRVFCSNGAQAWCVAPDGEAATWGVESPAGQPTLTPSTDGGLDAGEYQVAITYLDLRGEESGTGLAATVTVPDKGGIALSGIPQPLSADVLRVRVYVSPANGDVLYQARDVPVGQLVALIGAGQRGRPLATQFLTPMRPGRIVRYLASRLYVADGRSMRWSEPLRYGLTHAEKNVRSVGQRIDLMEPVGDGGEAPGFFVADHKRTYWLGGADPNAATLRIVHAAGAIPGTGITVPGNLFGLETSLPVAYWIAASGVACLGLPGGQVVPLRERQVVAPAAERGASLFRELDGMRQVITALQGATPQGIAIGDRASSRVYRNGIEV